MVSNAVIFLSGLTALAVVTWAALEMLGGRARFGSVYDTARSWVFLLSVLLMVPLVNTREYAFGVLLLTVLIACKGQHEVRRLLRTYPSHTRAQKSLDALFILAFILFIIALVDLGFALHHSQQLGILLFVVFAVQFNDIGQYLMGRLLGGKLFNRKLAPTISPNKTIEGALFGTLFTSVVCLLAGRFLTPFSTVQIFLMTLLLAGVGILGDLFESAVKRNHGVKDMGGWLKGHGGVMDRVDSLMLSVPLFWLMYRAALL